MKIVKDEAVINWNPCIGHYILVDETIEITDAECNTIGKDYTWWGHKEYPMFAEYLKALITLSGK
jgi:hypothetical protein